MTEKVPASHLPDHIGRTVAGFGELTQASKIDDDLVYARSGMRERTYPPHTLVELED